ncbi:MAG: SPFH domain-containing protein [Fimbriimonadaceae bacterium]|nr:SPFH domain-containing protein [Fimbriimonadaceae bacterium]
MDERKGRTLPGAFILVVDLLLILGGLGLLIWGAQNQIKGGVLIGLLSMIVGFLVACGFLVIEPNGSKVLILFGSYKGTVKAAGFHWVNPFTVRREVSLRARTLNGERLKVNDSMGNPIEIAAVIVWQVEDTYDALFRVDRYEEYVAMQSETALRHSASIFPYDAGEDQISLRRNTTEVADHLATELRERLEISGVKILEARLSHLAYAPEIAGAMLRRQQASAVIAARQIIVDGAVGMVELALARIERENLVKLDEERKATMVSNLMVVLCSEQAAQPVLNTGSLYT